MDANDHFMKRHSLYKIDGNTPECLTRKKRKGIEPYQTVWGIMNLLLLEL